MKHIDKLLKEKQDLPHEVTLFSNSFMLKMLSFVVTEFNALKFLVQVFREQEFAAS